MAAIILSETLSVFGGSIAGSIGASIGHGFGSYIGRQFENGLFSKTKHHYGHRIKDVTTQGNFFGQTIPIIYGVARLAGTIIFQSPIKETEDSILVSEDMFGGSKLYHHDYRYTVSLAFALCEGEIDGVDRIWVGDKLLNNNSGKYRLYKGTENQLPDPLLQMHLGTEKTPAFRGISYIVIEDLPLSIFGNHIPNFSFEVRRCLKNNDKSLENMIKSICIIPGSGEFVYDTMIQHKTHKHEVDNNVIDLAKIEINHNNFSNKADALVSFDQLTDSCPNLEWVAPVVTWFGNAMNIASCDIEPAVEYGPSLNQNESWRVGNYTRENAKRISIDNNGNPNYGGTINDASLLRYLDHLKQHKKIMLYPIIFMDVPDKIWRGSLTGSHHSIREFFYKKNGYRNFIFHYANLAKGRVDAFIIGSELVGLTSIKDPANQFIAVTELINLAIDVKAILGNDVIVTYAADWSEYHHIDGGWHHLDALWACEAIDVVGIDAYFPLTNTQKEEYDLDKVILGWESGEHYDFYYADGQKMPLNPRYACKNIRYWWENIHYNPDGKKTKWKPKSKKIWFTEYGFPSVDCAANQPNVFYNPQSQENSFPKHSKGLEDFHAQRIALTATENYWKNSNIVTNKFIWCWDARPYPFWPNFSHVWSDGGCWSRGHWINGKLGTILLADIIKDLCLKSGLDASEVEICALNKFVAGFAICEDLTTIEAITHLRNAYLFDIAEIDGNIKFSGFSNIIESDLFEEDLIPENGQIMLINRAPDSDIPKKLELLFMALHKQYQLANIQCGTHGHQRKIISLPLVLSEQEANIIAKNHLDQIKQAQMTYEFTLPPSFVSLNSGDIIIVGKQKYKISSIMIGDEKRIRVRVNNLFTKDNLF